VYDKRRLEHIPRRYTVEAGKELEGEWLPDVEGIYDLWVLGPNGFHRHVCGHCAFGAKAPALRVAYGAKEGTIALALVNPGGTAIECVVTSDAYESAAPWRVTVAGGDTAVHVWPLAASGLWYDFTLQVDGLEGYRRRLAGRVETGRDSISDPAMGRQGDLHPPESEDSTTSSGAPAAPHQPAPPMPGFAP
jgi:phospholipase C